MHIIKYLIKTVRENRSICNLKYNRRTLASLLASLTHLFVPNALFLYHLRKGALGTNGLNIALELIVVHLSCILYNAHLFFFIF